MSFEGQCGIQNGLHPLLPVFFDGLLDTLRVTGGQFDDLVTDFILNAPKQPVVLGEIRMTEHVCDHQRILGNTVAFGEIGTARVARKDNLVQTRMPHPALDHLVNIANTERPVRHAYRKPVDCNFQHETLRYLFEVQRKIIEAHSLT